MVKDNRISFYLPRRKRKSHESFFSSFPSFSSFRPKNRSPSAFIKFDHWLDSQKIIATCNSRWVTNEKKKDERNKERKRRRGTRKNSDPPKCRSRRLGRWHHHRCACITSYSLGCASSRQGIDRLNPRGPHGDSNFVRLRARPALLVPNMAPVGGHVVTTPSPTRLPLKQRAHSTTTRDICSHQFISLSLSLPFSDCRSRFLPPLSLARSLSRRPLSSSRLG